MESFMRLCLQSVLLRTGFCFYCAVALLVITPSAMAQGRASSDLSRFLSVFSVELSPDGRRIAYTVTMRDRHGRPYGELWIMDVATQKSVRVGGEKDSGSGPLWSPDGKWLAFEGHQGEKDGLFVARPDGPDVTFLAAERHQQPAAGHGQRCDLVARCQTARVHLRDPRRGGCGSQRRSHGNHAVPLQAGCWRGTDALQRQSAAAHFCGRRVHKAGAPVDPRQFRRAFD